MTSASPSRLTGVNMDSEGALPAQCPQMGSPALTQLPSHAGPSLAPQSAFLLWWRRWTHVLRREGLSVFLQDSEKLGGLGFLPLSSHWDSMWRGYATYS